MVHWQGAALSPTYCMCTHTTDLSLLSVHDSNTGVGGAQVNPNDGPFDGIRAVTDTHVRSNAHGGFGKHRQHIPL